ncbi:MAG: hypothetical protein ACYCX4_12950 [Bacillota bacterium]
MTKITYVIEQEDTIAEDAVKVQKAMFDMLYAEIKHLHELNGTFPSNLFQAYDMINLLNIGAWKNAGGGE